jgi:hypothetical protein
MKYLWKLKHPLKIIFTWFLQIVLLTKGNLVKRNWNECTKWCFCDSEEKIEHLFISCPSARLVWHIVFVTYNLPPKTNFRNMSRNWLKEIVKKTKAKLIVRLYVGRYGIMAIILCLTRLDISICRYGFFSFRWINESLYFLNDIFSRAHQWHISGLQDA